MQLYHRNVNKWLSYFDEQSLRIVKSANSLSNHMWKHINVKDKKHYIDLQKLFLIVKELKTYSNVEPFEVEVEKGNVEKCVIRTYYDENYDISIVFRQGLIVTAWLNKKDDNHNTLNSKKYSN